MGVAVGGPKEKRLRLTHTEGKMVRTCHVTRYEGRKERSGLEMPVFLTINQYVKPCPRFNLR